MHTAILEIIIILILISLSAFFSSSETALTTVSPITMKALADDGNTRAATVLDVLNHHSKMLSTILVCNNVVNLSCSSLITTFIIRYIGANAVSIGTAILTVIIILFGEITPKNMATIRAEQLSLSFAPIIRFLMWLLTPVVFIIEFLAKHILSLLGVDASEKKHLTENELKTYVAVGSEEGIIENREKKIIYNVFDFGDSVAKDIMTPRIDMICVSVDDDYERVKSLFRQYMFTRLPVYEGDSDNIIGLINIKDFIMMDDSSGFTPRSMLREAYYTYEYKKTADLLKEMQARSYNVAFVLNEYGGAVGMVTLEDLVEEIVGQIRDEYDQDERDQIYGYDDRTFLVEGSMKLDDINDALGSHFDSEDYDSIGGLIIEKLERLPMNNETVTLDDGTTLQAKGIRQNRIVKVLIRFTTPPKQEDGDEENTDENEKS